MHIRNIVEKIGDKYFANHMSKQMKELFSSVMILNFATSAVALFEPIYLYTIGFSLRGILVFYLIVYILYFFLLPLGGKIARAQGYEHVMLFSAPFLILYYLALFAIPFNYLFVVVAILALTIRKILYWPGYHADFAQFGEKKERGREISNLYLLGAFVAMIGPAIGGLVITFLGFKVLFIMASVLILLSNIPLLLTPEKFEPTPFSYRGAFKDLVRKEKRRKFFGYFGFGEEMISLAIWPIFIYSIVVSYDKIGLLVSVSIFVSIIIALFVGRVIDHRSRHMGLIRAGTIFTFFVWLFRIIITKTFGVFLIDAGHRISRVISGLPMAAITYNDAKKSSIMRSVIFKEMALSVGKAFTALVGIIILSLASEGDSWTFLFILSAIMTLFYGLFKKDDEKDIFLDRKNPKQP
ncbi:MAG: hypothetical protein HQ536_02720 [Parcubacteria group bacterium]|nr:hypothetical protein [Parcubacteria group bacterium]